MFREKLTDAGRSEQSDIVLVFCWKYSSVYIWTCKAICYYL